MPRHKSWSGLHPSILQKSKRSNMSAIVAKDVNTRKVIDVAIAFPGCDFEVLIVDEVAAAFKHGDVKWRVDTAEDDLSLEFPSDWWDKVSGIPTLPQAKFNALLVDHLTIALKRVTKGPEVVAKSQHFTRAISKAIEELDAAARKRKPASMRDAIYGVKERLFSRMMSHDMRRE